MPSQSSSVIWDIPITWRDVAIWLDTEGTAYIYLHHSRRESVIEIAQKDREPLDRLCRFLKSQGIRCKVRTAGKGTHILEVRPVLSQLAFIRAVRPLLMTRRKREQVDRLFQFLTERGKVGRRRKGLITQGRAAAARPR